MGKFPQITAEAGGTATVRPVMRGYKAGCCGCGLVHKIDFDVFAVTDLPDGTLQATQLDPDSHRVELRVSIDRRATGQARRHMKRDKGNG